MIVCAKCDQRLEEGLARCPACDTSLMKPGSFSEVLGWVLTIVSSIPIIIGSKTVAQEYYPPVIAGGAILFFGIVLVVMGRSQSRSAEETIKEVDADALADSES